MYGIIGGFYNDLPFLTWRVIKHASSAFTGAGSAHGDKDGANTYRIYTVTGVVAVSAFIGVVNTTLAEAVAGGRISLGLTGSATFFIANDDAETWASGDIIGGGAGTGGSMGDVALTNIAFIDGEFIIIDGTDIVETVDTQDLDGGQIDYYCIWTPMESGASIVEAGTLSQV